MPLVQTKWQNPTCKPGFGMNYCCAAEFLFKFFSGNFGRKTKSFAWETYMWLSCFVMGWRRKSDLEDICWLIT